MAEVIALANELGAVAVAAHIDRDKTGFPFPVPNSARWFIVQWRIEALK